MARYRINPNIRYYLPGDPYYYEVDNLPLKDLDANDKSLQEQIDNINKRLNLGLDDVGRNGFVELMPYFDEKTDGSIRVRAGNFIARINTKADLENGLMERQYGSDADSVTVSLSDPVADGGDLPRTVAAGRENAEIFQAKAAGRTAVVTYEDLDSLGIPTFDNDDFTDSDAPDVRIDLVYIQASPAMDESNSTRPRFGNLTETARLGYLKGGYFRMDESGGRNSGEILSSDGLTGKVVGLSQVDVGGRPAGTVPAPDDVVNGSYKSPETATGYVTHTPGVDAISLDLWAERQMDNLGVFCLPVAYVTVPRGYTAGEVLAEDSLIDIRPFFRSTELTLSERQSIATSYSPSLNNRFMTIKDPDYVHLKEITVKGLGSTSRQDHEGRISSLEEQMRGNANIEIYQPTHVPCMDGQEATPYYASEGLEDFKRDFVHGIFPGTHYRRNLETYLKTVRALRHKIADNVYMLYVQIFFDIADESSSKYGLYGTDTAIRQGNRSNYSQYPMPSGFYRLDVGQLGFTGASVHSIIATPTLELKTGGAAITTDIFRHSAYIEEGSGEARGGFIDFQFSCKDYETRSDYSRSRDWFGGDDGYKHYVTHGTASISLTLQGLSTITDLYDGLATSEDGLFY